MKTTIAIIGGGAAGVAVFNQLIEKLVSENNTSVKILILEKNDTIGPGLAYGTTEDSHIINLNAGSMNALPSNPNFKDKTEHLSELNFLKWARENQSKWLSKNSEIQEINADAYPPRFIFGLYLKELLTKAQDKAKKHNIEIEIIKNIEVKAVTKRGNSFQLSLQDVELNNNFLSFMKVNQIILCIGHIHSDLYQNFIGKAGYYHSPWPISNITSHIPKDKSVLILGTRLTAIDTVLSLIKQGHTGKIYMASRNGLLPAVIGPTKSYERKFLTLEKIKDYTASNTQKLSLNSLLELFWQEIANAYGINEAELDKEAILHPTETAKEWLSREINSVKSTSRKWQEVLASIYPIVSYIWNKLSDTDKKIFLDDYYSIWMSYLAAFPLVNAEKILDYMQREQLYVLNGLDSISYDETTKMFSVIYNKQTEPKNLQFEFCINATGAGHDIKKSNIPLLNSLIKAELISPHSLGGVNVKFKSLNPRNSEGEKVQNLFVVGDLTWGACMATADLAQIGLEARRVVNSAYKQLKKSESISIISPNLNTKFFTKNSMKEPNQSDIMTSKNFQSSSPEKRTMYRTNSM